MAKRKDHIQPLKWLDQGPISPSKEFVRLVTRSDGSSPDQFVMKRRPTRSRGNRKIATIQGRFQVEVDTMSKLRDVAGVIPIVDKHDAVIPTWYVMPKATPLALHLGKDPDLRDVVTAIQAVAGTLARIKRSYDIAHRDIKPDNLLWLGESLVADFGIAQVPDRPGLTYHGEKVGPAEFLAPEMRTVTKSVDGFPADVWSLAKTLFFLAMAGDSRWPPVGTLTAGKQEFSLHLAGGPAAYRLEFLLESATAYLPMLRPSMETFSNELAAWLESLLPEEGRRPKLIKEDKPNRISLSRENLHPASWLWSRRDEGLRIELWRTMLRLIPGRFFEVGALELLISSHGHDSDSHYSVHGLATTTSINGVRVVLVGFLIDGSRIEYIAEVQRKNAEKEETFDLIDTLFEHGAIEWPSGQRAQANMQTALGRYLGGENFPLAPEQNSPI